MITQTYQPLTGMEASPDGQYVSREDHERELAERDALIAKLANALRTTHTVLNSLPSLGERRDDEIYAALEKAYAAVMATPASAAAELADLRAEVARLKAGGCARDQRTTQYCSEASTMAAKFAELRKEYKSAAAFFDISKTEFYKRIDEMGAELDALRKDRERLRKIALWFASGETGVSSEFMAAVSVIGPNHKSKWPETYPWDAPDFMRCIKLLEAVPEVRESFHTLREMSPVWSAYIDHWEELVTLCSDDTYESVTNRMRELRNASLGREATL